MVAPSRNAGIRKSFGKVSKPSRPAEKLVEDCAIEKNAAIESSFSTDRKRKRDAAQDEQLGPAIGKRSGISVEPNSAQIARREGKPSRSAPSCSRTDATLVNRECNSETTSELPSSLSTLISLHETFVKSFTLHFAHNGPAAPAHLSNILESVTRLWKIRQVQKQDIRKMLASMEISHIESRLSGYSNRTLDRRIGSFKLFQSGLGIQHLLIEYVGTPQQASAQFNARALHLRYIEHIHTLWSKAQKLPDLAGLLEDYEKLPQLIIEIGAQQAARREKAQGIRSTIMSNPATESNKPEPTESTKTGDGTSDQSSAPSRSQSLLDRIRTKQLHQLSIDKPTPEQIAKHRAKGRLPEMVDILNIIQKQRTRNQAIMRISFQLPQLVQNIKDSVRVQIGDDEIRRCLKLLAEEVASDWVSIGALDRESGTGSGGLAAEFVVLKGRGMSGVEVKERIERIN